MIVVKSKFDGRSIEVPPELRGAHAGEVVIVYDASAPSQVRQSSIWNYFGRSQHPRTAADIDEQIRQERQAWDEA